MKTIKLCEGHVGGFGLLKILEPNATYKNTPVTKLKVIQTDKSQCVQCLSNRRFK